MADLVTAGIITLKDKEKTTEKTQAQVLTVPLFDSKLEPTFKGNLTYCKIRQIRKDPTIQLARWAVLSPMIHTPWTYVNNNGLATQEMLDYIENEYKLLREDLLMRMTFGTLDFGWTPFEIVYKEEDGYIKIDNYKGLLQDFTYVLVYINNGSFAGFLNSSRNLGMWDYVPYNDSFLSNFEVEGTDWYGFSVYESLKSIQESWDTVQKTANRYDKKIAGATWVIYYPVGHTPYNGVDTPNDEIARKLLASLEASGGVAIPDEIQEWIDDSIDVEAKGKWRIELVSANSTTGSSGFVDRMKYLDALKMRAFGLTERSVLEGSHGTKAEADVHGDVSLSIVDSRHRLFCNQLNLHAIPYTLEVNFGKKYRNAVLIRPAPLVDTQFATIKEIYRTLLQNPEVALNELDNLDLRSLRDEIGIPNNTNKEETKIEISSGDNNDG